MCYLTKAPSGIKRSPLEVRNNKADDEIEKDVVQSWFLQSDRSMEGLSLRKCVL